MAQLSWALLHNSIVERLGLIELFSVLRSILISMGVSLGRPARAIPECRVHDVARAIIQERLPWAVQVGLVLDVLVNLDRFFI